MQVQGRCHCGQVSYEAVVDPADVFACHCKDCQALTGAAYRVAVRAPAETFRLLSGTLTTYIKTAESGTQRAHSFCSSCGSPAFAAAIEHPTTYSLRVGALRQAAELPPQRQIWCDSAVQWSQDLRAIPQRQKQ